MSSQKRKSENVQGEEPELVKKVKQDEEEDSDIDAGDLNEDEEDILEDDGE